MSLLYVHSKPDDYIKVTQGIYVQFEIFLFDSIVGCVCFIVSMKIKRNKILKEYKV